MENLDLAGIGSLGILIFVVVLFILGVLMPLFVFLSYGELKRVNKNLNNLSVGMYDSYEELKKVNKWMEFFAGKTKKN